MYNLLKKCLIKFINIKDKYKYFKYNYLLIYKDNK